MRHRVGHIERSFHILTPLQVGRVSNRKLGFHELAASSKIAAIANHCGTFPI